jgi:hypothetical protein
MALPICVYLLIRQTGKENCSGKIQLSTLIQVLQSIVHAFHTPVDSTHKKDEWVTNLISGLIGALTD